MVNKMGGNNMDNRYNTLLDAIKVAETLLDDGQLLEDNSGTKWDVDNLWDAEFDQEESKEDPGCYYCVGYDGSIGYTGDNGYNVQWLYKVA
ncbi:hypothetical protein QE152_g40013 [Popillia japonica]|uniref:Uncharacterized protein n=1 Tax=Popillia japonica TaxID=7064 RepID=A0AAW1HSQ4_POPJA